MKLSRLGLREEWHSYEWWISEWAALDSGAIQGLDVQVLIFAVM